MKKFVIFVFLAMLTLAPWQVKDKQGMISFYQNKIPYAAFFMQEQQVKEMPVPKNGGEVVVPVSKEDKTTERE